MHAWVIRPHKFNIYRLHKFNSRSYLFCIFNHIAIFKKNIFINLDHISPSWPYISRRLIEGLSKFAKSHGEYKKVTPSILDRKLVSSLKSKIQDNPYMIRPQKWRNYMKITQILTCINQEDHCFKLDAQ